jgi:hypothetical protein
MMKLKQISGLGTAAALDIGTTAGCAVQIGSDGALPVVNGSNLLNVPSSGGSETSPPKLTFTTLAGGQDHTIPSTVSSGTFFYVDARLDTADRFITLPNASDLNAGEYFYITKNGGSYNVYVQRASTNDRFWSKSVNYNALAIGSSRSFTFMSDGVNGWYFYAGIGRS